jgi:hypothetical protein
MEVRSDAVWETGRPRSGGPEPQVLAPGPAGKPQVRIRGATRTFHYGLARRSIITTHWGDDADYDAEARTDETVFFRGTS